MTVIDPETIAPVAGDVMETVGGVVSPVPCLLEELLIPVQPELSIANGRTNSHRLRAIVFVTCASKPRRVMSKVLAVTEVGVNSCRYTANRPSELSYRPTYSVESLPVIEN